MHWTAFFHLFVSASTCLLAGSLPHELPRKLLWVWYGSLFLALASTYNASRKCPLPSHEISWSGFLLVFFMLADFREIVRGLFLMLPLYNYIDMYARWSEFAATRRQGEKGAYEAMDGNEVEINAVEAGEA